MAIMTHAKFHFNWLMLTSIFCIWASEPPPGPGKRLKRPGLIGLNADKHLQFAPLCLPLKRKLMLIYRRNCEINLAFLCVKKPSRIWVF